MESFNEFLKKIETSYELSLKSTKVFFNISNSGRGGVASEFSLSCESIVSALNDIKNNINQFSSDYHEKKWRDAADFFSDNVVKSLCKVQTRPFFETINKLISWANDLPYEDGKMLLTQENIEKLLSKMGKNDSSLFSSSDVIGMPYNRVVFGAPGTGKSHKLNKDSEKYFSEINDISQLMKEEIKNRPQDKDKELWFNHIGIKYASYIYQRCAEETEGNLQLQWGVEQNELLKMKTAARATIDYKHSVFNPSLQNVKRYERVTFHPNYSYSQFVGTYKPITKIINDKEEIAYEYVPGPFIRTFINARKTGQNVLLLIEEINRANVAAVFGDVFQLLDRDEYGNSEYPITTSEDLRKFLAKPENLGGTPDDYKTISLPSNMYIWATMNSADQGVFPMDTAFKRRWDFEYIGIDDSELKEDGKKDEVFESYTIPIPNKYDKDSKKVLGCSSIEWNKIRHAINDKLKEIPGVNEDKLLGPYFLSKSVLESATKADKLEEQKQYCSLFKSKILMYLYEDVVKITPTRLFKNCGEHPRYSDVCSKFDEIGLKIFDIELNTNDTSPLKTSKEPANE